MTKILSLLLIAAASTSLAQTRALVGDSGGNVLWPTNPKFSGSVQIASSSGLIFNARARMTSPSTGKILLTDSAGTTFSLIQLGGTTSSFPAIKRSGAAVAFRLADDSANARIEAKELFFQNSHLSEDGPGNVELLSSTGHLTLQNNWRIMPAGSLNPVFGEALFDEVETFEVKGKISGYPDGFLKLDLNAGLIQIGDYAGSVNFTTVTVDDANNTVSVNNADLVLTTPLAVSSGGTGVTTMPKVRVQQHASVGQSIANATFTKVNFAVENEDTHTAFSSGTFTAPRAGSLLVTGSVAWQALSAGAVQIITEVWKNGSLAGRAANRSASSGNQPCDPFAMVVSVAAGNSVEIYVYQNSGTSQTLEVGAHTHAEFTYLP